MVSVEFMQYFSMDRGRDVVSGIVVFFGRSEIPILLIENFSFEFLQSRNPGEMKTNIKEVRP